MTLDQFDELPPHVKWSDIVISGGVVLAAYSLCEAYGKPFRYVAYCPQVIPSFDHPLIFFPFVRLPKWINRISWQLGLRLFRSSLRAYFKSARRDLGLETESNLERYFIPNENIIFALDEQVVRIADDLQPAVSTGYFHLSQPQELPEDLLSFIKAGPPPLYVGFGSMTDQHAARTTRIILAAAQATGMRVVISQGWARLGNEELPPFSHLIGPVSHESLFPYMAGIIHHGGAGTTAAAARSGRPQAIIPHLLDQFYWAERVERLQVGPRGFWKSRLSARKMRALFKNFTSTNFASTSYETNAEKLGERLRRRDGLREAAEHIETIDLASTHAERSNTPTPPHLG